jgi:hypothetical protein
MKQHSRSNTVKTEREDRIENEMNNRFGEVSLNLSVVKPKAEDQQMFDE